MLTAAGVTVEAGGRRIIDGASLEAGNGEIHVILGPNGAGKTTLLKAITGLLPLKRGKVLVDGVDVTYRKPGERGIGLVPQGAPLLPQPTVLDHIALPLRARGLPRGEAAEEARRAASLLGVDHLLGRRPWSLSGGERQRVAIATAIASGARNLLLDEPFSSLDPGFRQELYKLLYKLRIAGYTIILTTHIIDDLVYSADRIWILQEGRVVESGRPGELLYKPGPASLLKPPFTSTIDCRGTSLCRQLGISLERAAIHYRSIQAVKASSGPRLLGVAHYNGDRVGIVEVEGELLYVLAPEGLEPGDHVALLPLASVGAEQ